MCVRGEGSVGGSARYSEGLVASVDICPRGRQWVRSLPWAHWGGGGGGVPCSEVGHTVAENESLLPGEEARTKEAV